MRHSKKMQELEEQRMLERSKRKPRMNRQLVTSSNPKTRFWIHEVDTVLQIKYRDWKPTKPEHILHKDVLIFGKKRFIATIEEAKIYFSAFGTNINIVK